MTTVTTTSAALVCSPDLEMQVVPVVISDRNGSTYADTWTMCDRAVAAAGMTKATGTVVALYEDGVDERPQVSIWDSGYGGVWATCHPDSFDVPEWPGVNL
jgi:hypothetical protein